MKIVFMGNPHFALPSLVKIFHADLSLLAIVSNPINKIGRGNSKKLTPVGQFAKNNNIPLLMPKSLNDVLFLNKLKELSPDLLIVVAFKILPESLLSIPNIGSINLHASLLPQYRGAAPIQRAIINGETETGLTTFFIQKKVDTGSIILQKKTSILFSDSLGSLSDKMSHSGSKLILKTINLIQQGSFNPINQNHDLATYAPKITEIDQRINWANSSFNIYNQIRGLSPNPGVFSNLKGKRFRIFKSTIINKKSLFDPGTISICTQKQLCIQTGTDQIQLDLVQKEGKRKMEIKDFLNGVKLKIGDQFDN